MGECGCISGNKTYKLRGPGGDWYVFQMLPGCDYCSVGPTIHISMPQTSKLYYEEELEHIPNIPTMGSGKEVVAVIKCGIPKDQAANLAIKTMVGSETEDNKIDECLAEILGEDFWQEAMRQAPDFVQSTQEKIMSDEIKPTDTEMLDWLDKNTQGYGRGWICRDSLTGRGLRLHETSLDNAKPTVREAIVDAMKHGLVSKAKRWYRCGCGNEIPAGEFCIDCDLERDLYDAENQ